MCSSAPPASCLCGSVGRVSCLATWTDCRWWFDSPGAGEKKVRYPSCWYHMCAFRFHTWNRKVDWNQAAHQRTFSSDFTLHTVQSAHTHAFIFTPVLLGRSQLVAWFWQLARLLKMEYCYSWLSGICILDHLVAVSRSVGLFFLVGALCLSAVTTWGLLADQRGIEPPPAVCQRHKSAAIPTELRGHLSRSVGLEDLQSSFASFSSKLGWFSQTSWRFTWPEEGFIALLIGNLPRQTLDSEIRAALCVTQRRAQWNTQWNIARNVVIYNGFGL